MEGFCDSGKFKMKEIKTTDGMTYLQPVHHRDLGVKSGELYGEGISWAEVAINEVPLEKTFQFEDEIQLLEQEKPNHDERRIIIVNSRSGNYPVPTEEVEEKKWVKRLEKIPLNSNHDGEKKRKGKIECYPVKPKSTKQVRDEKINKSSQMFQEITDEKNGGESVLDYSVYIHRNGDYEVIKQQLMMTPDDVVMTVYQTLKLPKYSIYCPPLHWLQPEVQWKKIWIHMNKLITGKERNYHYYPEGPNACGKNEPCIYFYDEDSDDLNYNFQITTDYMDQTQYWNLNYP